MPRPVDFAPLRMGSVDPVVDEVRARLERIGLLPREEQLGREQRQTFDSAVDSAVRSFQQERGISVDGVVGPMTFQRLEEARWKLGDRVVSYTYSRPTAGDDIIDLQRQLNTLGFQLTRIDGVFGSETDRALREFQRNCGLEADGTCGPEVWRALSRLQRTVKGGAAQLLRSHHDYETARTGVANKVVVIDPGHGGTDYGHVANRMAEAIVADDLSRRVEGRLAAVGTQVLLTRPLSFEIEDPIDERNRAEFANSTGADLVVSLHCDSEPTGLGRGVATYYYGHNHDESLLGKQFAEIAQAEIVRRTDLLDCRVHPKTWELLRSTRMPAVRIEVGYLSNSGDVQRLSNAAFREVLAEAIATAVTTYFSPDHERPESLTGPRSSEHVSAAAS